MNNLLPTDWLQKFYDWLTTIEQWHSPEGCLARFVVCCIVIYFLVKFINFILNEILELQEKWKKLGWPVTVSAEKKAQIRQRQQFCGVLRSDLATIAKAENWNDQFFTDLEAEVEAEGGYYTSALNRILKRPSYGLRRESSLIKSIDRSAESFLLIVGSPGSGKSVALRHLGHQLTERAIKSSSASEKIPLYINLKELPPVAEDELTPDFIKEFVLDNIRRGDADTVDYIRENWDAYRRKGIWFFLFDSFDEIPAVLHAPTGSQVIQQHSEAIRQFLEGMSSCRGVVASREFKGPETLSWQKFRILPLSSQRKEELIGNSFLKPQQKEIVRRHLATNESTIHNNPLFLTLLCRYVKEENAAPINDHDLLSRHINRLAFRDPDYTEKRYSLTPEELLQGASNLAVLFAGNTELSLAPSQNELIEALERQGESINQLENLLAALVDVKIARSDVQEARRGDQRFTFSHRRYQETLFVHYLSENLDIIPPRELLTDLRWREYTVTLLQTQPVDVISKILEEAEQLLKEYVQAQEPVPILPEFGGHLSYYEWDNKVEVALLNLLQEGLRRRIGDIPEGLSKLTAALLEPRWRDGDEYDRMMVLETGGTLPQEVLVEYLTYAIEDGSETMRGTAFKKMIFLIDIPEKLAGWLRDRLSTLILNTNKQSDILRLEAISSSLPDSVGSFFVFSRSVTIRKMDFIRRMSRSLLSRMIVIISNKGTNDRIVRRSGLVTVIYSIVFLFVGSTVLFKLSFKKNSEWLFGNYSTLILLTGVFCLLMSLWFAVLFSLRATGKKITAMEIMNTQITFDKSDFGWKMFYSFWGLFVMSLIGLPGVILGIMLNFQDNDSYFASALVSVFVITYGISLVQEWLYKKREKELRNQYDNGLAVIFKARSINELIYWLKKDMDFFLPDRQSTRSLLCLLKSQPQYDPQHPVFSAPLFKREDLERSNSLTRYLFLYFNLSSQLKELSALLIKKL